LFDKFQIKYNVSGKREREKKFHNTLMIKERRELSVAQPKEGKMMKRTKADDVVNVLSFSLSHSIAHNCPMTLFTMFLRRAPAVESGYFNLRNALFKIPKIFR
jgi:hypothetical protein